jgi:hypothetical protein
MKFLAYAVLLALVSGPALADTANTVDWYVAHPDERKAEAATCENDPGDLQNTPDCINAKAAGRKALELEAKQKLDNAGNRIDDAYHDLTK